MTQQGTVVEELSEEQLISAQATVIDGSQMALLMEGKGIPTSSSLYFQLH